MMPILPHLSSECIEGIKTENEDLNWPIYDEKQVIESSINIVIQINGKKRGLIKAKPNMTEENLFEIIKNDETLMKYIDQKNLKRKIYIQDKLINIII